MFYGLVQTCALLWAPVIGILIDRLNRVTALCIAVSLAAIGYTSLGLVTDPIGPQMFAAAVVLGMGEVSGVLASQALIGQEAPDRERGSVFGTFGFTGAIGILAAVSIGGLPLRLLGAVGSICRDGHRQLGVARRCRRGSDKMG